MRRLASSLFPLVAFAAFAGLLLFGCSTPGIPTFQEQLDRNQQIQDCVIQGGHPHLGPNNTILCD